MTVEDLERRGRPLKFELDLRLACGRQSDGGGLEKADVGSDGHVITRGERLGDRGVDLGDRDEELVID